MFASERHEKILEMLQRDGKVYVNELSSFFGVTEDCIRKDLNKLEKEEKLQRTHGGAILPREKADISILPIRRNENLKAKEKIARKAFGLLTNGETVFLDISTTNILLAEMIADSDLNLTIMTNMLDIIIALKDSDTVDIICTGGIYKKKINGFVGSEANKKIQKYKFNKVFIGVCGVNLIEGDVTTLESEEGNTKEVIVNAGKEVYLVMENRKFKYDGFYRFASTDEIKGIITDEKPYPDICKLLDEKNILLI
jgi:DeoR/GlpR family transcriptional regulator of sugar metabolism